MQKSIYDTIARISNGQRYRFSELNVVKSILVISFLKFLYSEGFIRGFTLNNLSITVFLKYYNLKPSISYVSALSKPSKRVYLSKKEILVLSKKKEIFVILTSKGFFSSKNVFESNFEGGEIVCILS
tara:strand:+ start:218 stop:598 length:381 start_codon:yes stop_codon:yes gene_type:complete